MKLRVNKKVMAFDFSNRKWTKAKIVDINLKEGIVRLNNTSGYSWEADITEFDDPDCFKEG
jgi:hypothetical protein